MAIQLSGGEKRRLTIARALATSPKLLMLDEPFRGVDPIAVSDIQKIVMELRDTDGLSILITDHNVDVYKRQRRRGSRLPWRHGQPWRQPWQCPFREDTSQRLPCRRCIR